MKIYRIEVKEFNLYDPHDIKLMIVHHGEEVNSILNIFDVPIHSKHDELFGSFHIFLKQKFMFFKRNIGFVEIRNSLLEDSEEKIFQIISADHMGTYITINTNIKIIGYIKLKMRLNNILVHQKKLPGFNIFQKVLFQNKIFFLVSLLVPLMEGSTTCKLKCLKGLYILIRLIINKKKNKIDDETLSKQLDESKKKFHQILQENTIANLNFDKENSSRYSSSLITTKIENLSKKRYKTRSKRFYKKILKNYYYAIGCYTNPLIMHGVDPQLKFVKSNQEESIYPIFTKPVKINFEKDEVKEFNLDEITKYRAQIIQYINIPDKWLLEVSLNKKVPHLKFQDNKSLIISFRGTESANDIFSDINCDYIEFLDGYVHRGILELAEHFLEENEFIINDLMIKYNLKYLKLVGHSLGAAIASICGIIFKQKNEHLKVKVYAFSPASCLSYDIAKKTKFIKSYILGTDIFPRLSYGSMLDLKYLTASIGSANQIIKTNSARRISKFEKKIKKHLRNENIYPKLYCGGLLYHFENQNDILIMKRVDQKFFDSICVDFKFLSDHVPRVFVKKLKMTLKILNQSGCS